MLLTSVRIQSWPRDCALLSIHSPVSKWGAQWTCQSSGSSNFRVSRTSGSQVCVSNCLNFPKSMDLGCVCIDVPLMCGLVEAPYILSTSKKQSLTSLSLCASLTAPGLLFLNSRPLTFQASESLLRTHLLWPFYLPDPGYGLPSPLASKPTVSSGKVDGLL